MSIPAYQDILQVICSEVVLVGSTDAQHVFTLNTAHEAKLAYDIMVAHGMNVRVYHEPNLSKLYVTPSATDAKELPSALHYAGLVRHMLDALPDADTEKFSVTFTNTPTHGKQFSVYFPSYFPSAAGVTLTNESLPQTPVARLAGQPAVTQNKKQAVKTKSAIFGAGPALAKKDPFTSRAAADTESLTLGKRLSTYVFSNFTQSFYAFIIMIAILLVVGSAWVVVKGYLCPDLATVKKHYWYCTESNDE